MTDYVSTFTLGRLRMQRAEEEEALRFLQTLINLLQQQTAQAAYLYTFTAAATNDHLIRLSPQFDFPRRNMASFASIGWI